MMEVNEDSNQDTDMKTEASTATAGNLSWRSIQFEYLRKKHLGLKIFYFKKWKQIMIDWHSHFESKKIKYLKALISCTWSSVIKVSQCLISSSFPSYSFIVIMVSNYNCLMSANVYKLSRVTGCYMVSNVVSRICQYSQLIMVSILVNGCFKALWSQLLWFPYLMEFVSMLRSQSFILYMVVPVCWKKWFHDINIWFMVWSRLYHIVVTEHSMVTLKIINIGNFFNG